MGYFSTDSSTDTLSRTHVHRLKTAYRVNFGVVSGLRFYSPALGRWVSRDPIEEWGGVNLYQFVGNAPIYSIDPYGEMSSQCKCCCADMIEIDPLSPPAFLGFGSGGLACKRRSKSAAGAGLKVQHLIA